MDNALLADVAAALADVAVLAGLIMSCLLVQYNRKAWFIVAFWAFELVSRFPLSSLLGWFGVYFLRAATVILCLAAFVGDWRWGKVVGK